MSIGSAAAAITIGSAIGTAGAGIYAAHKSSQAAEQGATTTANAANYAADLKAKSDAASLAFEKQKDAEALAQFNATQKANYDQWAAREARMNDIRAQLGLPSHAIPAFVPTPTLPGSTTTSDTTGTTAPAPTITTTSGAVVPGVSGIPGVTPAATPSGTTTAPTVSGNPTDRNVILQNLQNVYKSLGVTPTGRGTGPTDIQYMADQVAATGGWTPANAGYWPNRIKQELANAGGGSSAGTSTPPNTIASYLSSSAPAPVPQMAYMQPGQMYSPTIASYLPQ